MVYKKGVDNSAADSLSRRPHSELELLALVHDQSDWLSEIVEGYQADPKCQELLQQLSVKPDARPPYQLSNGVLRYKGCLWIGNNAVLQQKLFAAFHDSPVVGHSGFPVTYKRIHSLFRWPGMKQFIRDKVASCLICQQAKPERVSYPGLLAPLPVPPRAWHTVTMDFISGLPTSGHYDCILVIIDKFTKYGHFIPLKHPFTANKVADVFLDNIYKLHSMPKYVVSDRDPIFTSSFWQTFLTRTGCQLKMSSADHPQSDGQTERVNQQIECYLRCFISSHPKKWAKWLSFCELWYNTNWHSSLNKSPFEVLYGHSPCYFGVSASDTVATPDVQ